VIVFVGGGSSDDSLVQLLASLAAEASQDFVLEPSPILTYDDAIATAANTVADVIDDGFEPSSQHVLPLSAEERQEILEQSQEMSQRVWDNDADNDEDHLLQLATDAAADDDDDNMYVLLSLASFLVDRTLLTVKLLS